MRLCFLVLSFFIITGCQTWPFHSQPWPKKEVYAHLPLKEWKRKEDCCQAVGGQIAISSGGEYSSKAGLEIHRQGGNAVDVAVTVAFALAVERPSAAGIGGGGFALLYIAKEKKSYFLDFRETAPSRAGRDMFLDEKGNVIPGKSTEGALAIATPGFVAGLYELHRRHGKLPWRSLFEPVIRLAAQGVEVDPHLHEALEEKKDLLIKEAYTREIFFPQGEALSVGKRFFQSDLAKTLKIISEKGRAGWDEGIVADKIIRFIKEKRGLLSETDLVQYKPKWRAPLVGTYKNFQMFSAPPPSSGGILLMQMLGVLERFKDKEEYFLEEEDYTYLLTEIMSRAYADRSFYLGDPDFSKAPFQKMIEPQTLEAIAESISFAEHRPSSKILPGSYKKESANTTHLNVMDKEGNVVSSTITINTYFGSGLAVPGVGVFLNNEMDDFSVKPGVPNVFGLVGQEANSIQPGKRPLSSMSPTIFLKEGEPILSVGAAGGSRIISAVLEISLRNLVLDPWNLKTAVFSPRFHFQWLPDVLFLEEKGFSGSFIKDLAEKKLAIKEEPINSKAYAVQRHPVHQMLMGVFDPRGPGGAAAQ